jgi:hypothetical protein
VSPCDRDFHNFELKLFRQIKYFRVEAPPFNLLQREDGLGGMASEGFEAALCILEIEPKYDAQQQVENTSKNLAVKRLPLGLQIALQPA